MKEININVNINAPQICEVISKLADALNVKVETTQVVEKVERSLNEAIEMPIQETPVITEAEEEVKSVQKDEEEIKEQPQQEVTIDLNELKATCAKAKAAGVEVGAILKEFGSTKLSAIDPIHYVEIYNRVKAEQEAL